MHSDDKNRSCKLCGHNICALKYNNEEYYYNSQYKSESLQCNDNNIRLPCTLIKKNGVHY